MVVREGKTIQEVCDDERIDVSIQTLTQWSIKYGWQEKKDRYMNKPVTVATMTYDILYSELVDANQRQMQGEKLSFNDIAKLEKLIKMYKQTGLPFTEQVFNVMKVFLRYIERNTGKDSPEQTGMISFVKDFAQDVESGIIQPEE